MSKLLTKVGVVAAAAALPLGVLAGPAFAEHTADETTAKSTGLPGVPGLDSLSGLPSLSDLPISLPGGGGEGLPVQLPSTEGGLPVPGADGLKVPGVEGKNVPVPGVEGKELPVPSGSGSGLPVPGLDSLPLAENGLGLPLPSADKLPLPKLPSVPALPGGASKMPAPAPKGPITSQG